MNTEDITRLLTLATRARQALDELDDALSGLNPSSATARQARYDAVRRDYEAGRTITLIQRKHGISRKTVYDILNRFPDLERRNDTKARLEAERAAQDEQEGVDFMFSDPDKLAWLRDRAAAGTLRQAWFDRAAERGIDLLSDGADDLF